MCMVGEVFAICNLKWTVPESLPNPSVLKGLFKKHYLGLKESATQKGYFSLGYAWIRKLILKYLIMAVDF